MSLRLFITNPLLLGWWPTYLWPQAQQDTRPLPPQWQRLPLREPEPEQKRHTWMPMPLQPRQWIAPTTITLETCANFFRMRHYDREIPILEQRTWVGFDLLVGMFARQRKLATPLTLGAVASTSTAVASSSLAVVEISISRSCSPSATRAAAGLASSSTR